MSFSTRRTNSNNKIPRIADPFGLNASKRTIMMATIYATQSALNTSKSKM